MLARNHNILQEGGNTVEVAPPQIQTQKKRVKMIQSKPQQPQQFQPNLTVEELDEPEINQFQMEDE